MFGHASVAVRVSVCMHMYIHVLEHMLACGLFMGVHIIYTCIPGACMIMGKGVCRPVFSCMCCCVNVLVRVHVTLCT